MRDSDKRSENDTGGIFTRMRTIIVPGALRLIICRVLYSLKFSQPSSLLFSGHENDFCVLRIFSAEIVKDIQGFASRNIFAHR